MCYVLRRSQRARTGGSGCPAPRRSFVPAGREVCVATEYAMTSAMLIERAEVEFHIKWEAKSEVGDRMQGR